MGGARDAGIRRDLAMRSTAFPRASWPSSRVAQNRSQNTARSSTSSFVDAHGRRPTVVEQMRLRQVATIATRPAKTHTEPRELTASWRARAAAHVAEDDQLGLGLEPCWPKRAASCFTADDLAEPILNDAARRLSRPWPSTTPPTGARTFWPSPTGCFTGSASLLRTTA